MCEKGGRRGSVVVTECLSVSHCSSTAPGSCKRRQGEGGEKKKMESWK